LPRSALSPYQNQYRPTSLSPYLPFSLSPLATHHLCFVNIEIDNALAFLRVDSAAGKQFCGKMPM
jgi:hypothetical protein